MDLSTMMDKVTMKAYTNIGIDFRYDFESMVNSFKTVYHNNRSVVDLCSRLMKFGIGLILKADAKMVQRAKDKPMAWHFRHWTKQKRDSTKNTKHRKAVLNQDPVDVEGYWKIPYSVIKYKGDPRKLEKVETFRFQNPFPYQAILKYVASVERREQGITMQKLKTSKMGRCNGEHCSDLSKLGPYDVHSMQFITDCPDRRNCMECSLSCGCDPTRCQNRAIQRGQRKVMGRHVVQQLTFGIDQSTRRRISKTLIKECGSTQSEIDKFIEFVLQPSFNSFLKDCHSFPDLKSAKIIYKKTALNPDTAPFFMTDILRMLLHRAKSQELGPLRVNSDDILMTETLLSKISKMANRRNLNENQSGSKHVLDIGGGVEGPYCEEFYPIYPKGNGVICIDPQGIDINAFIIEYFGEVYPAWRWYEKCDLQKQVTRALSEQELPDFFNIMLERHDDDPDGYDLLSHVLCGWSLHSVKS